MPGEVIQESEPATPADEAEGEEHVLADSLHVPWSIQKHGEDTFFLPEREGHVLRVSEGNVEREQILLEQEIHQEGEAGLLGFILAPDFADSQRAYAYHTYQSDDGMFNRIVALLYREHEWIETKELLAGIPGATIHNGGRLAIGPDELLYATTGDANKPELSQERDSLAGKILRLETDGAIPTDNPFPSSYLYSYGHRNPQGLAWSHDGELYSSEHGPTAMMKLIGLRPEPIMAGPSFTVMTRRKAWKPRCSIQATIHGHRLASLGIMTGSTLRD